MSRRFLAGWTCTWAPDAQTRSKWRICETFSSYVRGSLWYPVPLKSYYLRSLDFRQPWTPRIYYYHNYYYYYYYYYRKGGLTREWRVIWKFSFWSIFTFKTLFSHSTARRRTAWRARFRGSKAERARGARSVPSLSTLARTPPLPRERVWGFWCAPRRSEGPHEAKFPFNSLSNAIRSKISGSNRADKSENFPLGGVHSCLKSRILARLGRHHARIIRI